MRQSTRPAPTAALVALLVGAACGPAQAPDADPDAEATQAAQAAAPAPGEPEPMVGMMTYVADAATFTECATGDFFPIAMEGDYMALEHAYLSGRSGPGEPLLVSLTGSLAYRSGMEGDDRVHLVVDWFEGVHPGAGCGDATPGSPLEGVEWVLVRVEGATVPEGVEATLTLEAEARSASGSSGCNRFSGPYWLVGGSLTFGALAATRMGCASPANDVENAYLRALGSVGSYRMAGTELELLGESGPLLRFRPRS